MATTFRTIEAFNWYLDRFTSDSRKAQTLQEVQQLKKDWQPLRHTYIEKTKHVWPLYWLVVCPLVWLLDHALERRIKKSIAKQAKLST